MHILRFFRNLSRKPKRPQNDYSFGDVAGADWAGEGASTVTSSLPASAPSGEDWADWLQKDDDFDVEWQMQEEGEAGGAMTLKVIAEERGIVEAKQTPTPRATPRLRHNSRLRLSAAAPTRPRVRSALRAPQVGTVDPARHLPAYLTEEELAIVRAQSADRQ